MTVVVVLLAVAVGVLALLVFGLLRTHAEILRALDRAGISLDEEATPTPRADVPGQPDDEAGAGQAEVRDVVGTVPAGGPTKVAVAGVKHFTLLAFLSSGCRTCKRFWEAFAQPDLDLPGDDTRLVIVGQDPAHDSESALAELVPTGVKAVLSSAAWQDYDVPGSPYFALVDGVGGRVVGAGSALSWEQLRDLLNQALSDSELEDPGPTSGDSGLDGLGQALAGSGLDGSGRVERLRSVRRSAARHSGRSRAQRAEQALRSAGIGPGHPSLYPAPSGPNGDHGGDSTEARSGQ